MTSAAPDADVMASGGTCTMQDSPLLRLPPEIRNIIYEYACLNIDKGLIEVHHTYDDLTGVELPGVEMTAIAHSLESTCRQTRGELKPILACSDPSNVRQLIWHVQNFHVTNLLDESEMLDFVELLPRLADGTKRTLEQRMVLDNTFHFGKAYSGIQDLCSFGEDFSRRGKRFTAVSSVHFDVPSFTTAELGETLHVWERELGMWYYRDGGLCSPLRAPIEKAVTKCRKALAELEQDKAASHALEGREG